MIAGNDLDQRGFAGAVIAEQAHDLIGSNFKVDMVEGSHLAECLGNILHLEYVFHWTTSLFFAARGRSPALQRLLVRLSWEMR